MRPVPMHLNGWNSTARLPLPVEWRLMCNGEVVTEAEGPGFKSPVDEPGSCRVEAWLDVVGEADWILSNPIHVRASGKIAPTARAKGLELAARD